MKKLLTLTAAIALIAFIGCKDEPETVAVTGVTLAPKTVALLEGADTTLLAVVLPTDAANQAVTWTTSTAAVATVTAGKVTAVAEGSATITVTTDDGGFKATSVVTVTKRNVPVESVTLNKATLDLDKGATETLTAEVLPTGATNKNVHWESNAEAVATVNAEGLVTAVSSGAATITVTTEDGEKTDDCVVTVTVPVASVSLNKTIGYLIKGDTLQLTATVLPTDATDAGVTWSTDDEAIATVNASGEVVAVADGEVTITVTTDDGGKTAECTLTIDWLGEAYFATDKTWEVGDQVWSNAVEAKGCKKTTYKPSPDYINHVADCRTIKTPADYAGDFFSWTAVDEFAERLCPGDWEVPSKEDFLALDAELGGTGVSTKDTAVIENYLTTWGAQKAGAVYASNSFVSNSEGRDFYYWSKTKKENANLYYHILRLYNGQLNPAYDTQVDNGHMLRCVKAK